MQMKPNLELGWFQEIVPRVDEVLGANAILVPNQSVNLYMFIHIKQTCVCVEIIMTSYYSYFKLRLKGKSRPKVLSFH